MYYFYIVPIAGKVKLLAQKKNDYESVIQEAKDLSAKRDQILQDYNTISQEDMDKLNKALPDKFDSVIFINDLTNMASKRNLSFGGFTTTDNRSDNRQQDPTLESTQTYRTTGASFKIEGKYADVLGFLNDIETSLRIIDVVGIDITLSDSTKLDSLVQALIEVDTYSLK
jgi:Tfp pilus assembly protein PilO